MFLFFTGIEHEKIADLRIRGFVQKVMRDRRFSIEASVTCVVILDSWLTLHYIHSSV